MSFKGSSKWKAAVFDGDRGAHSLAVEANNSPAYIKCASGDWILFGPRDIRGGKPKYNFALQYLKCDKQIRVRVGCRYYTLPQAWKHWSKKVRTHNYRGSGYRNEGKQALVIISLMILQAQAYDLLSRRKDIVFDSSITRPKRK